MIFISISLCYDFLTSVTIVLKGICTLTELQYSDTASGKSRANSHAKTFCWFVFPFPSTESTKKVIILWDFIVFMFLWRQNFPDIVHREMSCLPCIVRNTFLPDKIRINTLSLPGLHYYQQKWALSGVLSLEMRSTIYESVTQDVFLLLTDKTHSLILTINKYSLIYHSAFKG